MMITGISGNSFPKVWSASKPLTPGIIRSRRMAPTDLSRAMRKPSVASGTAIAL